MIIKENEILSSFDDLYESDYPVWVPNFTEGEIKKKLLDFLSEYGDLYDSRTITNIKNYFLSCVGRYGVSTTFAQLYSYLEIYPKNRDPYIQYIDKLMEHFEIDVDVLDVASGEFPTFAIRIAQKQIKLNAGTITMYDPALVCKKEKYPNMCLHKEKFTREVSIEKYDLVTAILPCTITDDLIRILLEQDKNFFIAFCGCFSHDNSTNYFTSKRLYEKSILMAKEICKQNNNGELLVEELEPNYHRVSPILIYKNNLRK